MNCSWSWRQLLNLRSLVKNCFVYKLGDGSRFSFWLDQCCEVLSFVDKFSKTGIKDIDVRKKVLVCDINIRRNGNWTLLLPLDRNVSRAWDYTSNKFVLDAENNHILWKPDRKWVFSVSSIWKFLMQDGQRACSVSLIWSS